MIAEKADRKRFFKQSEKLKFSVGSDSGAESSSRPRQHCIARSTTSVYTQHDSAATTRRVPVAANKATRVIGFQGFLCNPPHPLLIMTVVSTLLRLTAFRNPFLRTLVPSIGLAYAIQTAVGVPSIAGQTERFYDLSGSLTYLSCTALSLYLPTIRARHGASLVGAPLPAWPTVAAALKGTGGWDWRMVVLSAAVSLWAARLGTFLFARIMGDGEDSRFEKIRSSPPKFFVAFFAQATWVSLCLMPVLAINSLPAPAIAAAAASTAGISLTDILGLSLFVGGFGFEALADHQKSKWSQEKKEKKHSEQFLTRGLWSKSRHPNYFGEITLWTGIATVAGGVLCSGVGQVGMGLSGGLAGRLLALGMVGVSPAFVTFLLTQVSGIPMSESKYDKRFKGNKDYEAWKANTPMLIPKF